MPTTTDPSPISASLALVAQLCHALRHTRSRLDKAKKVGEVLRDLNDEDLCVACRYLCAQPFAAFDARGLSLGPSALLFALAAALPGPPEHTQTELKRQLVDCGDFSLLAERVMAPRPSTLRLADVDDAFAAMAQKGLKPSERRQRLADLLLQATPVEAGLIVGVAAGELRIGFARDALLDALARLFAVPLGTVLRVHMLLGDVGETAVHLRHQRLDPPWRPFHSLGPMLASPFVMGGEQKLWLTETYIAQDKYDGIRAQAHVAVGQDAAGAAASAQAALPGLPLPPPAKGHVALFSRTHEDITATFADLARPLCAALGDASGSAQRIVDGELLAVRDGVVLPFSALQQRLNRKKPTEALMAQVPVVFVAFDLLADGGELLLDWPYERRLARLEQIVVPTSQVWLAPSPRHRGEQGLPAAFDAARRRGHEGLVLKDPSSLYTPGKRGRAWVKIKQPLATLDVVVVRCEVGFGRKRKWLSDLTFAVRRSETDPTLVTLGKAYSGLTDADLQRITPYLHEQTEEVLAHGKVRCVRPTLVLEVAFDRVAPSNRHKSGFALRFPRIVRVRWDKAAEDIDTLQAVEQIANAPHGPIGVSQRPS